MIIGLALIALLHNVDIEDYIEKYHVFAIYVQEKYKVPASICLAQAILESGYGTSNIAQTKKNHFGMTIKNGFKQYKTVFESYDDYGKYFNRTSYCCNWPHDNLTAEVWAYKLKQCKYAHAVHYDKELLKIIYKYKLKKYDICQ